MPQFHETGFGRAFFEHQLPELIKSINRLADSNRHKKIETATRTLMTVATETTKNIPCFEGAEILDAAIQNVKEALKETT